MTMRVFLHASVASVAALLVLACGSDGNGDDGPADAGDTGDVALCAAAATRLATTCDGDGERTCASSAYATVCASSPDALALAEAIDCLEAESGTASCRTFADPSGARDCVADVYAGAPTNALIDDILSMIEDSCESSFDPLEAMPPLFARSDDELAEIQDCIGTTSGGCQAKRECTAAPAVLDCFR